MVEVHQVRVVRPEFIRIAAGFTKCTNYADVFKNLHQNYWSQISKVNLINTKEIYSY